MKNYNWYLLRVKKISIAEYPFRICQFVKKIIDKHFYVSRTQKNLRDNKITIKKTNISDIVEKFPLLKSTIIDTVENVTKHNFEVFGIKKNYGSNINWHLDPKTNKTWPLKFWGDIDYRNGKRVGGIKFAWELNRFHHLPILAIAFSFTRNNKYKDEIFFELESWLELNPYPKGINWIMGIELGIRIVNVFFTLKFLDDELSERQLGIILKFISLHGNHIYRYRTKHSSNNNHTISEALGLFVAGLCFPSTKSARKWKYCGKNTLENEVMRQIYPDGSNFEHSVPYLQFVLDHYLIFYLICKEYGETCSHEIEERLKSSFNFISQIVDSNGNYPLIGDGDDGYLLMLWLGKHNNFISLLNTGAILFNKPELILDNAEFDQKTFFLLGKKARKKWDDLKARKNNVSSSNVYFSDAGLAVIRDKKNQNLVFIGNSGPLGLKPLGGHGHADALSFWLSINGQPIFVDPGTYLYHSGGVWRDYFRSTMAHNTLRVDYTDQATPIADFIYKRFYTIKNVSFRELGSSIVWTAGHDGFMKKSDPVFHKRKVVYYNNKRQIVIEDFIDCRNGHFIECFFHLHPRCLVNKEDIRSFSIDCNNSNVFFQLDEKWDICEVMKGENKPIFGWYSPGFNELVQSYSFKMSKSIKGKESFCTVIDMSRNLG